MRGRWLLLVLVLWASPVLAQTFSSGSTGADGAATCSGGQTVAWQVPDSGIFNFTTVNIGTCNVSFIPNQRNTPVIVLAQGDIVIYNSTISVDASGRTPGPGGFYGGAVGQAGFGPGGGAAWQHGQWVGPLSLVPPIGGSGGGGANDVGGGGGGAIVFASSTSIQCNVGPYGGGIYARGSSVYNYYSYYSGSGGAIRLLANSVSGTCELRASGGSDNNHGIVRVEAQSGQLLFTGPSTPSAVLTTINPAIIPTSTTASLSIASIGGFPVPSDSGVRPGTVDVVLPRALTDPIGIVVQGRNIPIGTQVNLNASGSTGLTYTPGSLVGSLDLSTATVLVSGLDRSAETHLFVFATFDVPQSAALLNPAGPYQVAKLRLEAAPGKPSMLLFLRKDGSEIDPKKLPKGLLAYFNYPTR